MKKGGNVAREGYLKENYHYFHLRDTAGQERDFHFHDFDKIVLLLAGRVDYTVENVTYSLRPWDVLLVKHHTIHKAVIDRAVPYDRVIVYLDRRFFERSAPGVGLMDCFDWADQSGQYLLTPDEEQKKALAEAMTSYEALIGDRQLGAQMLRDSCISRLLVHVNRLSVSASLPRGADTASDPKIAQVLSYINGHYQEEIRLEDLAARFFVSKYYLSHLFRRSVGTSVYHYILLKRLQHARQMLAEGSSPGDACQSCGFQDYANFYRSFRQVYGISPQEAAERP